MDDTLALTARHAGTSEGLERDERQSSPFGRRLRDDESRDIPPRYANRLRRLLRLRRAIQNRVTRDRSGRSVSRYPENAWAREERCGPTQTSKRKRSRFSIRAASIRRDATARGSSRSEYLHVESSVAHCVARRKCETCR